METKPQAPEIASTPPPAGDVTIERLFAPGERWGWEWRDINDLYVPFPTPPPPAPTPPPHEPFAADRRDPHRRRRRWRLTRWLWAIVVFLFPFVVLAAIGVSKVSGGWWVLVIACWALGAVLMVARGHQLSRDERQSGGLGQRSWDEEWARLSTAHELARREWEKQARLYHEQEQARLVELPVWGAVRPLARHRRIDIYGGVPSGWKAIVTTLGASLLGSGERVFVLDLSEEDTSVILVRGAEEAGLATRARVLPKHLEHLDVFDGMGATAVRDIIVEALHADGEGHDRPARSIDDRILGEVCETIAQRITFERILAGLRVLLRDEPPPDPAGESLLSAEEWRRLAGAFNDEYRSVIREPLVALESQLSPLRLVGRLAGESPETPEAELMCDVVAVGREGGTLLNELLVDLLVQAAIRRLRLPGDGRARVVFVIGADLLRQRHLERLDQLAATLDTRIVYLFRHLRDDALRVAGEAVAAVMRVGNPEEAEKAAGLIGRGHRFKLTQRTATVGSTDTSSWGESWTVGRSGAWMNWSRNESLGRNVGGAQSKMTQEARSTTLVDDYILEPEVLRSLPPTALVVVELSSSGRVEHRRVADCNPVLGTLPRVSLDPFGAPSQRLSSSR
ncbi:MAG TPA: hypothetical protein VNY31_06160 [Solirubrobacteraceae bacterium]|jgi:hypothetical protein|nr:hypothetical protein [Solirubrobacteraceae bacterium]